MALKSMLDRKTGRFHIRFPWALLLRAAILTATASLAGVAANWIRPNPVPWVGDWSRHIETAAIREGFRILPMSLVRSMLADGQTIFLDARPAADYAQGHLPGALSAPADNIAFHFGELQAFFDRQQSIVVYCSSDTCDEALLLLRFLRGQGYTDTVLLPGGFEGWRQIGGEVER